ncbi:MAG: hypothetical protein JJ916_05175 [Phycisphaerales bacterium]|nr:hypothetical protein [Phycisphaerales bacterium]
MPSCMIDPSIERKTVSGFKFPLGVYPVEPMTPMIGYTEEFEPEDNAEDMGDWESWPDQYVFDIVVPADRVESLWQQLFAMMPGRVFPIIDYIGHDAYREIDPYMAYEPIGKERMTNALRQYQPFFFEDGMVGFGAVSESPFFYIFVDEHKIVTVRVEPEFKARVEKLLEAFDIPNREDPAGADAAAHEHRSILVTTTDRPDMINGDEILERMRDAWRLILNVDPDSNVDDEGNDLGMTPWLVLARFSTDQSPHDQYVQIVLTAESLRRAEEYAQDLVVKKLHPDGDWFDVVIISANRLTKKQTSTLLKELPDTKPLNDKALKEESTLAFRVLDQP